MSKENQGVPASPSLSHPFGTEPVPVSGKAGIANAGLHQVCRALCQSGKFETGEGGCAAICMSMLGSSRGGPNGCAYVECVHSGLAQSVLDATGAPELLEALEEAVNELAEFVGDYREHSARAAIARARGEQE